MAGLERLPIDLTVQTHETPEQRIVHQAMGLLAASEDTDKSLVGNVWFERRVTHAYEAVPDGKNTVGFRFIGAIAMVGLPTMELSSVGTSFRWEEHATSEDYTVVDMQFGVGIGEDDGEHDVNYDWRSYILMVINQHDPDEVAMLDARTGRELSYDDVMYVEQVMKSINDEHAYGIAEGLLEDGDLKVHSYQTGVFGLTGDFTPQDYMHAIDAPQQVASADKRQNASLN